MNTKNLTRLLFLTTILHAGCIAQTVDEEKNAIKAMIQESYIGGAYNDDNTKAMKKGFHESVTIQDLNNHGFMILSLKQWLIALDRQKWLRNDWNNRTTAKISVIGLEGNVAVARVDIYNDKIHDLTDFLSLYKFKDEWKITNRVFTRHATPPEVHQKRIEEWEKAINEKLQPPQKVMDAIGVNPGMIIGELGAGRGRYTVHLAKRVGKTGKIYANDINDNALSIIRERCEQNNINNVVTILGKEDDPLFPKQALDMAIMIWVYHGFDSPPITLLKNLKSGLKTDAPLIIIEPTDSEINTEREAFGMEQDPNRPASIIEKIKEEAGKAGFELIRVETFLPKDYICILRVKDIRSRK